MSKRYEFELGKAADLLVRELFKLKPGEEFLITADTEADFKVVEATARAAFTIDAKPMILWHPSPMGIGKAADPMLPLKSMAAALKEADAWVEFNTEWLLYSTPWDVAIKENPKLRYLCLCEMDTNMIVRCIGRVNFPALKEFQEKVADMTRKAKTMRITTPAGTDVGFKDDPKNPVTVESGYADTPGPHFLSGQIAWTPKVGSVNGTIVFDGSVVPLGMLKEPVKLTVKEDKIVKIEGGKEATEFKTWLKSFNDPHMFLMAHVCYGFHPNAKLTGVCLEDERIWGCTEWGVGNVGPHLLPPKGRSAASHSDGICLNSSVWLDNVQITGNGKVIHPELVKLAKKLGKA